MGVDVLVGGEGDEGRDTMMMIYMQSCKIILH